MSDHTPSNPTKMPSVPTGPTANRKASVSKPMKGMPKASGTTMGKNPPPTKRGVSPTSQSQTVHGGPRK